MEETITISKRLYDDLVSDRIFLGCLQQVGVDNWSGYDDAVRLLKGEVE